jgi:hypothetical protein
VEGLPFGEICATILTVMVNRIKQVPRFVACAVVALMFALFLTGGVRAQEVTDKMVATVNSGVTPDLITYSDLLWQLAMEPNVPLQNPRSEDLNHALQLIIDQRLIAQEAEKLPTIAPTEAEIDAARDELARHFAGNDFVQRLQLVGFTSASDDNFRRLLERRVATEKYIDFRFRAFVVVTPLDEENFYRDTYVPRFRQRYPDRIVPDFAKVQPEINRELTENKIAQDIGTFLETARERAEIVILNQV